MAPSHEKQGPVVFLFVLTFIMFVTAVQSYAQAVSGMREATSQLKPLLDKEKAQINAEVIWSSGTLAFSPTLIDPTVAFRSETGAIVGAIYVAQPQSRLKLTEEGVYAVKLKKQGTDWLVEFLNVAGAVVSTIKAQPIELSSPVALAPTVYFVPSFISPSRQPMLLWCWDNFCSSLTP